MSVLELYWNSLIQILEEVNHSNLCFDPLFEIGNDLHCCFLSMTPANGRWR